VLDYWAKRARKARHPLLRARYADLVWDLSKKIDGYRCPPDLPRIMIDATIQLAARHLCHHEVFVIKKLGRALSLALSLRDDAKICAVRDAIVAFEDGFAKDKFAGTWGFGFDLILDNPKIPRTPNLEAKIVADLEARLPRLAAMPDNEFDPHCVEGATLRLATYYRRVKRFADLQRVLVEYANAYLRKSGSSMAFMAAAWLQQVYETLLRFNLKDEADQVAVQLREYARKGAAEMKPISVSIPVDREELAQFLDGMTAGNLETAMVRLIVHFIPNKKATQKQVLDLAKNAPLQSMVSQTLVDHEGRPVAGLAPVAEALDAHVVHQISQNMKFSAMFLRMNIEKLIADKHLTAQAALDYVYRSPLFEEEQRPVITAGLQAFFEGQWLIAIHLLVPQIEKAVRNLVGGSGRPTLKKGRQDGSLMLKTLDELLREEIITTVLGDDTVCYLKTLLTDQRGWNVRNNVCHALIPASHFGPTLADRLFHTLLVLGTGTENAADQPPQSPAECSNNLASEERNEQPEAR
jgi:hypothetical protein